MGSIKNYDDEVSIETENRKLTIEFINIVHDLWYDKSIELVLFKNSLIDKRASEVLNLISYAKGFINKPISIIDILSISKSIHELDLQASKLDIGKLVYEFHLNTNKHLYKTEFVKHQLKEIKESKKQLPKDVILYGFGRIGARKSAWS